MKIARRETPLHGTAAIGPTYWAKLDALQQIIGMEHDMRLTRRDVLEGLIDYYLEAEPAVAAKVMELLPARVQR